MGFLDILFPKYCVSCRKSGSYLCADCFAFVSFDSSSICLVCSGGSIDSLTHPGCRGKYTIDGAFSSIAYKGVVKKLLYTFKYKPYLSDLRTVLVDFFYEGLIQNESLMKTIQQFSSETIVFVPIPLHNSRFKKRGYNHAEILAKGLSKRFNLSVKNILKRVKKTQSQFGLKKKERKENVLGAFEAMESVQSTVFLVDDILTTGSTLLEAAKTLKKAGAKRVYGITLARD